MKTAFAVLLIGAITLAVAGEMPSKFTITTKRKDDAVEVEANEEKTVFVIKSPSGISQAVVARKGDKWPEAVFLRLHLNGLESLRASNGKVTLDGAVSVQDGKPEVRLWKDGKEDAPLDEKSTFWMEIRVVGRDGKAAKEIPLKDGYFEMALPRAFFEGEPKSITINWIDFHRN